jgi:hypothetical protein
MARARSSSFASLRTARRTAWRELLATAPREGRRPCPFRLPKNVVAVGIGDRTRKGVRIDERCIRFFVEQKVPARFLRRSSRIPGRIDGHTTDVVEVGRFWRTQGSPASPAFQGPFRPLQPGCSVGWSESAGIAPMAGTLGAFVRIRSSGRRALLSNNHVLAAVNQLPEGTPIDQPSPIEPGASSAVARLGPRVDLLDPGTNYVDAACALLDGGQDLDTTAVDPRLGVLHSPEALAPRLADTVHKVGRTTGYTLGSIIAVDVAVTIDGLWVGPKPGLRFERQFLVEGAGRPFAAEGDSGSLVVQRAEQRGVGLIVAASDRSNVAAACKLSIALKLLEVDLII